MENSNVLLQCLSSEDVEEMQKITMEMFANMKVGDEYKGHIFTPGFSAEAAKFAYEEWTPKKGDVFLVSYPKTGTNWMGHILQEIIFQNEKEASIFKAYPMPIKMIESGGKNKFKILDNMPLKRRVFGSHLPADLINVEKIKQNKAKIVYVLCNPKDQIVSWYKFIPSVPPGKIEPIKSMINNGWDKFFEHVVAGDFPLSLKQGEWYPDHLLSWNKYRDDKDVYFVQFEDLKKDLPKQIKLIAEFLEAPMTDETAIKISDACSFDNMKKNITKGDSMEAKIMAINMRKGGVGGWKDYFTVSQSERIDAIMEEKLKDTDIKFTYQL